MDAPDAKQLREEVKRVDDDLYELKSVVERLKWDIEPLLRDKENVLTAGATIRDHHEDIKEIYARLAAIEKQLGIFDDER